MRRVRMLALCLVVLFAMTAVGASSAMAAKEPLSSKQLEKLYAPMSACPTSEPGVETCVRAETEGGKDGGSYTVGSITIPLNKKIILQGGEHELSPGGGEEWEEVDGEYPGESFPAEWTSFAEYLFEEGGGAWYEAKNDETLVAPPLKVPGGLTNRIAPQPYWPKALTESFENAKKNHELTATETLKVVGRSWISRSNLLVEGEGAHGNDQHPVGTAFHLPMAVVVNSPWLSSLGGGTCHVGSTEHPIVVELTSGQSTGPYPYEYNASHGYKGELFLTDEDNFATIKHSTLVDNTLAVTTGAEGCGGAYESYVDAAISKGAGVPSPAGANSVILSGTLRNSNTTRTACVLGEYTEHLTKERCEKRYKVN